MRVLMFLTSTGAGGAERMTITLANELARQADVELVVARHGILSDQIATAVRIRDLAASRARWAVLPLARLVRASRPDVLFASKPDAAIAAAAAWFAGGCRGALVLRESNHRSAQHLPTRTPFMAALAWAYRRATRVVAPSRAIADDLYARYRLDRDRIETIPNPQDLRRISELAGPVPSTSGSTAFRIRAVGRLVRQKGFDLLLRATRQVLDRSGVAVELAIAGDGPDRSALLRLSTSLGLQPVVHLPGLLENPCPFVRGADLFVLPSRWEGFPNALVEAMALGVPVVACRCPGVDEIVEHERNGMLCEPGNPDDLAVAMLRMLTDAALRARCAAAGAERVRQFDAYSVTCRYRALFASAAQA
jgi:glycosyltransferase involved in cell wall biosynthesis